MKYTDLTALLDSNVEAKNYFNSLPAYVKDQINDRAENINSFESLRDYSENLLRGDN